MMRCTVCNKRIKHETKAALHLKNCAARRMARKEVRNG